MKKYFKKFLSSMIFSGFGIFTLLFFSPLEVYMGNPSDFRFFIDTALIILGITSLVLTLLFSIAVSFLPIKVLKMLNLSIFAVSLCYYIQSMFLNGALGILTGESFGVSRKTMLLNGLVWCFIFLAVFGTWFFFKKKKKEKPFINATKFIALAFVAMQLTGFFSMYINYDKTENLAKSLYYSVDGQLEVSEKNNVLYFIIDYCDTTIVNEALKEDPELFSYFNGFTYYTDASYTHSRTFPAITYMLSGEKCYFDKNYKDYVNDAIKNSQFLKDVDNSGADIRVYTDPRVIGTETAGIVDNYKTVTEPAPKVELKGFLIQSLKVSGYRGMPYVVKKYFFYDTETVNTSAIIQHEDVAPINNDPEFYNAILSKKVSVNNDYEAAFRFYHMYGSHPGAVINENAEYQQDVSLQQALRGNLVIIKNYLEQLKATGAYDNSTIIIAADHGEFKGYLAQPQTCLLLVKERMADTSKPVEYSGAPVCQENIFPTVIRALGGDHTKYGKALDEVGVDEQVIRYHYNTEVDMSNGYETILREYAIEGKASDLNNYKATGNQWTVKSSLSPHY